MRLPMEFGQKLWESFEAKVNFSTTFHPTFFSHDALSLHRSFSVPHHARCWPTSPLITTGRPLPLLEITNWTSHCRPPLASSSNSPSPSTTPPCLILLLIFYSASHVYEGGESSPYQRTLQHDLSNHWTSYHHCTLSSLLVFFIGKMHYYDSNFWL